MANYRIISSDNHVFEPPDLWTSRVQPKFRDRAPYVISDENSDVWIVDGARSAGVGSGSNTGVRFEAPESLSFEDRIENLRPGGFIPDEHVKDMDTDSIDVSIVYPTVGLGLYKSVEDSELFTELNRAYNDWVGEFCSAHPKRLKGIAMINIDYVPVGVQELERSAKLGFVGAMIPVTPPEGRGYDSAEYESLWAAAQDLQMPLSLHITTQRPGPGQAHVLRQFSKSAAICNADQYVRNSLANMIFSGVFERYPKLKVGSVEQELSWVPHFVDRLNFTYGQRAQAWAPYRFKEDVLPGEYFRRNVFLGFQEDTLGLRLREFIGVDNIQWGSDYPHHESTFPKSREILEEILTDCTEQEKAKIAGENAARIYRLD